MAKRLIRVVPLYWLLTVLIGVLVPLLPALASQAGVPDAGMVLRSLLFIPYFDGSGQIHPVLFIGWTLNYEMFFYVLFATGLLVRNTLKRLIVLSIVLVALVAIGLADDPDSAIGITYTSPLLLEFGAGLWLHGLWQRTSGRSFGATGRLAAQLVMAGAALALIAGAILWPAIPDVVKWGVPAVAIVASALMLERPDGRVRHPLLLRLGEASYAVYLVHPLAIKAMAVLAAMFFSNAASLVQAALLLATVLMVGVAGVAVNILIERPLLTILRRRILPTRPVPAGPRLAA